MLNGREILCMFSFSFEIIKNEFEITEEKTFMQNIFKKKFL